MVGIDLVQVARIEKILEADWGGRFLDRLLNDSERAHLLALPPNRRPMAASALFAMKEAVIKASECGLSIVDLKRVQVEPTGNGGWTGKVACSEEVFRLSTSVLGDCVIAVAMACR